MVNMKLQPVAGQLSTERTTKLLKEFQYQFKCMLYLEYCTTLPCCQTALFKFTLGELKLLSMLSLKKKKREVKLLFLSKESGGFDKSIHSCKLKQGCLRPPLTSQHDTNIFTIALKQSPLQPLNGRLVRRATKSIVLSKNVALATKQIV